MNKKAATAATHPANRVHSKADQSRILSHFTLPVIAMSVMSHMVGADGSQGRCKNPVMLSTTLKPQQQKGGKQQTTMKNVDAEWHTIIDRLNELADDLSKLKEAGQQQDTVSDVTR